jgi:hypothetical protein
MDNQDNIEPIVKTPLLKEKKPRAPQSEKQKDAFRKAREKLIENHKKKKEEKIMAAKRDLLEKEGYVKKEDKPKLVNEPIVENIQFEINDSSDESAVEPKPKKVKEVKVKEVKVKEIKEVKQKEVIKEKPKPKPKQVVKEVSESESDLSDTNSESSEEIVIIKRTKKNKKSQPKIRRTKSYDDENDYEESVASLPNYNNYFV